MKVKMYVCPPSREDMPDLAGVTSQLISRRAYRYRSAIPLRRRGRCPATLPPTPKHRQTMGCNSSQVAPQEAEAEAEAKAKLKAALDEAGDDLEKIEALVAAAKTALEAALEEASEDQDKVMWLADYYSRCDEAALLKTPGALPPEGTYTKARSPSLRR